MSEQSSIFGYKTQTFSDMRDISHAYLTNSFTITSQSKKISRLLTFGAPHVHGSTRPY